VPAEAGIEDGDAVLVLLDPQHDGRGQHLDAVARRRTPAGAIGLDTSTMATVVDRLEPRGLMQRSASQGDRRVRLLTLTDAGRSELVVVLPAMQRAKERILQPLTPAERAAFMRMLRALFDANNGLCSAPSVR
jgi:DNA-binding PadR family transcriptional regulator